MTYFKSDGLNLYYEIKGQGEPLLLINGLSCDTRAMSLISGCLEDSFTVINYDMRCAGKSDKPDEPFTIAQVADETLQLVKRLGYNKINILGFSMGGMVAIEICRAHKEIIDKLFLVATAPSFKRPYPATEKIISMLRRTDLSPALLKEVYESMYGRKFRNIYSLKDYIRLRVEDTNPQPAFAYLRQLAACESFDAFDFVCKIDVPTLIVAGDEDKLIPAGTFKWLNENIADSKLSVFKNVGHVVPLEAPEELAALIKTS